ncbi:MAG: response regulator [Anaerolineae bacterium]|nr:response regulator [Anaerolineae bacterium]
MARILVIDDDPHLQRMVGFMVEREGHQAILSKDATTGLDLAVAGRPDLIILDVMMPDASGYDITRQLRANPETAHIPILVLTARSQPMDQQMALDAGADGFLAKPLSSHELLAKINEILGIREGTPGKALPVITTLGLRGGVGATTIAVNLALALIDQGERVCLLDLSPYAGHAALLLHLSWRHGWGSFLDVNTGPPKIQIQRALIRHESTGLMILPAPIIPTSQILSEDVASTVLATLVQDFDCVVVDAPALGAPTIVALRASRSVVLPMSDDVPSIHTVNGSFMMMAEMELKLDRARVVLNHVRRDINLTADAVQNAIKRPIDTELPYEPKLGASMVQGIPILRLCPDCGFVHGILRLARNV